MANKKLTKAKEVFDKIIKGYYDCGGPKNKSKSDKLFERALFAKLELKECEDIYLNDESMDFYLENWIRDFTETPGGYPIKFNNENVETAESGNMGKDFFFEREDRDYSSFDVRPVFGYDADGEIHSTRTVGIKFELVSKLGCAIEYTEVDFETLKEIQNSINILMDKIESCNSKVKVIGYGPEFEFETKIDFYYVGERTDYLNCNKGLPDYYQVVEVKEFKTFHPIIEYGEIWRVEFTGTEINVIGYPCDFKFSTKEKFSNSVEGNDLRNKLLQSKLGENYYVKNVIKKENGEEWNIICDGIEDIDTKSNYKITIKGYPDTFSFNVSKKFKPFDNDDFEADDDGRTDILLIKMFELNVKSNGHAYNDFIIERVKKVKGGEEWILGS